ncbi:MAG: PilW family protein [Verrucomicrobiota bacterium]
MKRSRSTLSLSNGAADGGFRSAVSAFSLVEIMIAVTLLSVIILGLMAMFSQTQRAFRLGMNQTDVLESGRLAADMISRELEQARPSYKQDGATPGFYSELMNLGNSGTQVLPGTGVERTNLIDDLFFQTRENQTYTGVGYFVRTDAKLPAPNGYGSVGTLYRYETNATVRDFDLSPVAFADGFTKARLNGVSLNVSKIMDGVVHFQVRAYDTNGIWITPYANQVYTNISTNIITCASVSLLNPLDVRYAFTSNAVPAFVEMEIGILEHQAYERYKSIPVPAAQTEYLRKQAGRVHVFRQRIPIRNVDHSAYQ